MLASVLTGAADGVDARLVQVEVHLSSGLPTFAVVEEFRTGRCYAPAATMFEAADVA